VRSPAVLAQRNVRASSLISGEVAAFASAFGKICLTLACRLLNCGHAFKEKYDDLFIPTSFISRNPAKSINPFMLFI